MSKLSYEELEAQVKQLAAENAALKSVISESWSLRDVMRQLLAARPGGCYFIKWEPLILKVLNETPATDAFLTTLRAEAMAEAFNSDKHAALCDSAYVSGMQAGWNFGVDEDAEGFQKALEAYRKPMREARAAQLSSKSAEVQS